MAHRIRTMWQAGDFLLTGPVEADETYIGGEETNKHESRKLKARRGTIGKTPVTGVKDRATKEVRAQVTQPVNRATMQEFVEEHVAPDATLYIDESSAYDGWPNHETVRHSVGEYVQEQAHTNGIESFWALLKRGYYGTYHKMSDKLPSSVYRRVCRQTQRPRCRYHRANDAHGKRYDGQSTDLSGTHRGLTARSTQDLK